MALLAKGGMERMRTIIERANQLPEAQRQRVLTQMLILAGLRGASEQLKMELKDMGMNADIRENVFLREIWEAGEAKGLARGIAEGKAEGKAERGMEIILKLLASRFGPLPEAVHARVRSADGAQIDTMADRMLTAQTLEEVLGTLP